MVRASKTTTLSNMEYEEGESEYHAGRDFGLRLCRWEHGALADTSAMRSDGEKLEYLGLKLRKMFLPVLERYRSCKSFAFGMVSVLDEQRFGVELCNQFSHFSIEQYSSEAARTAYFNDAGWYGDKIIEMLQNRESQELLIRVISFLIYVDGLFAGKETDSRLGPASDMAFQNWLASLEECRADPVLFSYCMEQEEVMYHRAQVFDVFQAGAMLHGTAREVLITDVVKGILPPALHLAFGQIVDATMKKGGEHDVIVTNSSQMLPLGCGFSLIPCDTVECILEVKSMATASELGKAVSQLRKFHETFTFEEDGSQDDYPLLGIVFLKEHLSLVEIRKRLAEEGLPIAFVAVLNFGVVCRFDLCFGDRKASKQYVCLRKPGAFMAVLIMALSGRVSGNTIWNEYIKMSNISFWIGGSSEEEEDCWKAIRGLNQQAQRYNNHGLKVSAKLSIEAFLQHFPRSMYEKSAKRMLQALIDQGKGEYK